MAEEMVILTRTFDLLAWLLPKAESLPARVSADRDPALDGRRAGFSGSAVRRPEPGRHDPAKAPAGGRRRPQQTAALPAPGPSLALAERRAIPARQRDGGGIGPAAGRVDEKKLRRFRACAQETPRFAIGPTDGLEANRADGTHPRHLQSLRLGPQTGVGGQCRKRRPRRRSRWACSQQVVTLRHRRGIKVWDEHASRNPMLLLRLSGALLLRYGGARVGLVVVPGRHRAPPGGPSRGTPPAKPARALFHIDAADRKKSRAARYARFRRSRGDQ